MRDQRGIEVSKGNALLHLQSGLEYTVKEVEFKDGKGKLVLELELNLVTKDKGEPVLTGFLKIPRLDEEARTEKVLQMAGGR